MLELIALIILICSLAGLVVVVFKKMPLFLELPEALPVKFSWKNYLNKIKNSPPFKNFSSENFLQKVLSKIRVLILKTENKTSGLLQKLREKAKKKKLEEKENDHYWQEVKKFKEED